MKRQSIQSLECSLESEHSKRACAENHGSFRADGTKTESCDTIGKVHALKIRPHLDLVDKLRAYGIERDIPIPQIAVMGDQSSGKSSVLEFISGIPFPRGSGLVTKCATQLTMKKSDMWRSWAEIESIENSSGKERHIIESREDVATVISKLTEELCKESDFSDSSIVITIEDPDVPDLTLIDLPGIVRTTTSGQSKAVISMVDNLINKYLKQERTIVLAVIPADIDIAVVDILERAQQADPTGDRTIGVLTKVDKVSSGDEAQVISVLENVLKPLKLGYVALKNRSTQELKAGMTLAEARYAEKNFFTTHPAFSNLAPDLWGVDTLTNRLIDILVSRIQVAIPEMERQVQKLLDETTSKLSALGRETPQTPDACKREFFSMVHQITTRFATAVDGTYSAFGEGSERWARLYARVYAEWDGLREDIHATWPSSLQNMGQNPNLELVDIVTRELQELRGRDLTSVFNSRAFNFFVTVFVQDWVQLSNMCLERCLAITTEIMSRLVADIFKQFPFLQAAVHDALIVKLIQSRLDSARQRVEQLLKLERDPFTLNHYLWDTINNARLKKFEEKLDQAILVSKHPTSPGLCEHAFLKTQMVSWFRDDSGIGGSNIVQEAEEMIAIVHAYWKTATKRYIDNVCNVIDEELCKGTKECLMETLTNLSTDSLDRLFVEDGKTVLLRKSLTAKLGRLISAKEMLHSNCLRE